MYLQISVTLGRHGQGRMKTSGCWWFFTIEYELTRAFARVGEEWPRNCVQWHNAPEMHLIFLKVQYICNFFAISATIKYSFSNCSSTCFSELIS